MKMLCCLGLPHIINTLITYKENETYFTAVLELGDMFDGGGVPIDHYIIQVDNGRQLETAGPTYSFDIMYNTTLSVNISAHNCVGYSNPFPLEIEYEQGWAKTKCMCCSTVCNNYPTDSQEHITTVTKMSKMTSALMTTTMVIPSQSPTMIVTEQITDMLLLITIPVATAAITVIIVLVVTHYRFRRCYSKCLFNDKMTLSHFAREVE